MYTIVETESFKSKATKIWTLAERLAFFEYLAKNPLMGDVIKGSNGLRKIRWSASNHGKRGGVRIIYYNLLSDGEIYVLDLYAKNKQEDIAMGKLKNLR